MSRTITVTQALSELKLLDSKVAKLTRQSTFILGNHNGYVSGFATQAAAESSITAGYDKVTQLIKNRAELKGKVAQSNAETTVKVGAGEMTVAEAIERKTSIGLEESLLSNMKHQLSKILTQRDSLESRIEQEVNRRTEALISSAGGVKPSPEMLKGIEKSVRDVNEFKLVDPLGLQDKVDALEASIEEFTLNIDVALSVVNATTSVSLSY